MFKTAALVTLWFPHVLFASGNDDAALIKARTAVERVYYAHRLGLTPSFEEALPPLAIGPSIRNEQRKAAILQRVYGTEITPEQMEAEVRRIDATTRDPVMLADVKAALGNDRAKFAEVVAKPLLVERLLRLRFDDDDAIHAPEHHRADAARAALLAVRNDNSAGRLAVLKATGQDGELREALRWELTPAPAPALSAETPLVSNGPARVTARGGAYRNEATAELARVLSSPDHDPASARERFYFADLPAELQDVLRVQLRHAGDVSAVIETPESFLLFLATGKTADALTVCSLTIPKRSYDAWLAEQPDDP